MLYYFKSLLLSLANNNLATIILRDFLDLKLKKLLLDYNYTIIVLYTYYLKVLVISLKIEDYTIIALSFRY